MALQDGMVLLLQQDATYNSLVNTLSTVPVGAVNKQAYPLVVYHQGTTVDLLDVNGSTGNRTARVQFDAYSAKSYTEAKAIIRAIRKVFQNLNNVTLPDASSTFVQAFFVTQESDLTFVPQGALTVEYRIMVEIEVNYLEAPTYLFTPLVTDNFHRANEEPLNPANWTTATGQPDLAVLNNVCVVGASGYGYEGWTGTSFPNNQYVSFTVSSSANASSFFPYIRTDLELTTGYQLGIYGSGDTSLWVLYAIDGGAYNLIGVASHHISSGDVITLAAVGTTILAVHNGAQLISATDSTGASGLPVFAMQFVGTQTDTSISLFQAGSVAASS